MVIPTGNPASAQYESLGYVLISRAMSGIQHITDVFLTATEATARDRLHARGAGTQLDAYLTRSATMARHVETTAHHRFAAGQPTYRRP
jgi:hypothetical protein